jgi:mutator protein MutT
MTSIPIALALVWKGPLLLIAQRRKGTHLGGFWEFPGGRLEVGESAAEAATREVREETGVLCTVSEERPSFEFEYPDRRIIIHPVDCTWISGEPQPLGSLEPKWVSQSEIAGYMFPPANLRLLVELQENWKL